ncbi:MAG: hypothetical protein ABSA75_14895, partial [Candidatus Bathyarchaeia archaeon]
SSFQLSLREIQSRNFKETEKSESSKALLQEAKQLFNLPARCIKSSFLMWSWCVTRNRQKEVMFPKKLPSSFFV